MQVFEVLLVLVQVWSRHCRSVGLYYLAMVALEDIPALQEITFSTWR